MAETESQQQEEDLHETKHDFHLVDLSEHDDSESTRIVIIEKDALIGEPQVKLQREKYIISYYEQENKQFETKHELMEIQLIKAKREAEKAKDLLDEAYGEYTDKMEEQVPRRWPRTRGLKRALELEKQKEVELANELTLNEQFAKMVNENQEHQLERVKNHLENLLDKAKRDNNIQRKMAKYYCRRNKIARAKLNAANVRIEALTHQGEKNKLCILAEASLHAQPHQALSPWPISKTLGSFLVKLSFLSFLRQFHISGLVKVVAHFFEAHFGGMEDTSGFIRTKTSRKTLCLALERKIGK